MSLIAIVTRCCATARNQSRLQDFQIGALRSMVRVKLPGFSSHPRLESCLFDVMRACSADSLQLSQKLTSMSRYHDDKLESADTTPFTCCLRRVGFV